MSHHNEVNGILLLDKPYLLTSNIALQKTKRLLGAHKAGHMGCLDPMATGMLPLCFGEATKFAQYGLDADKCYSVTACFGVTTTTGDAQGEVVKSHASFDLSAVAILQALPQFVGNILQTPPMYSALKHQGKKLYELARKGQEVERQARSITIYEFTLLEFNYPQATFKVRCSKGTYIRALLEDLGAVLGMGAHLTQLRRLYTAGFEQQPMVTLEDCQAFSPEALKTYLLPMDSLLDHLPSVILPNLALEKLYKGQVIDIPYQSADCLRLYDEYNHFQGLGEWEPVSGKLKAKRLLAAESKGSDPFDSATF